MAWIKGRVGLPYDPALRTALQAAMQAPPGDAWPLFDACAGLPLALVRGRHSRVVMAHHARLVNRVPQGEYHTLPGGHMFPLERPQDTARLLKSLFMRWEQRQNKDCA